MGTTSEFELSRIYAKGWSAGRASELSALSGVVDADIDALNPYQAVDERLRWATGYKDALRRNGEVGKGRGRQGGTVAKGAGP